ncbi:MAG: molecular chaperone DnaJ [Chloroflexota bacterium]
MDYYEVLGVPYSASPEEITRAYRQAMKRIHPDRQRSDRRRAEEQAKLLNRAYATLRRPETRRQHDVSLKHKVVQQQIMSSYFGGFAPGAADVNGTRFRRPPTAAERRARQRDDQSAMVSIVVIFTGVTLAVIAGLVLWAALSLLARSLF